MGSMGSEELVCRSQLGVLGLLRALFLHGGALWSCRREFSVPFLGPRNPSTVKTDSGSAGQVRETMQLPTPAPWSSWAVGLWRSGVGSFTWEDTLILTKIRHLTALYLACWCMVHQLTGYPRPGCLGASLAFARPQCYECPVGPVVRGWHGCTLARDFGRWDGTWGMSNKVGLMGIVALRGCPWTPKGSHQLRINHVVNHVVSFGDLSKHGDQAPQTPREAQNNSFSRLKINGISNEPLGGTEWWTSMLG